MPFKKLRDLTLEQREIAFQDAPHDCIGDNAVAVYQPVPKTEDAFAPGDTLSKSRVQFKRLIQSFADNFELPFNRCAEKSAGLVILNNIAPGELLNLPIACAISQR